MRSCFHDCSSCRTSNSSVVIEMKSFIATFNAQVPGILDHLNKIRDNVGAINGSVERLKFIEKELCGAKKDICEVGELIKNAIDHFGIAVWAKDIESRFIFANKVCCRVILHNTFLKIQAMTDDEFKKDALACVCMESDRKVLKTQETKRFIESARYEHEHVFLDVVKSPIYNEIHELSGTIGSASDISENVPEVVKRRFSEPASIEIPLKTTISNWQLIELLK